MGIIRGILIIIAAFLIVMISLLAYIAYINLYTSSQQFHVTYLKQDFQENSSSLQFYPNMRFQSGNISYFVGEECDNAKKQKMQESFSILQNKTTLNFYYSENPEITINCGEEYKKGELFVAGEGGPSTIINSSKFNIIKNGKILLLSESCSYHVEIHELLHVLGFSHSQNKKSIMYNLSSCTQILPDEIIQEIIRLYSYPVLPDLYFSDISAFKHGNYLDINISVRNQGLKESENFTVILSAEEKEKLLEFESIEPGAGRLLFLKNLRIPYSSKNVSLIINNSAEIDKENNRAELAL